MDPHECEGYRDKTDKIAEAMEKMERHKAELKETSPNILSKISKASRALGAIAAHQVEKAGQGMQTIIDNGKKALGSIGSAVREPPPYSFAIQAARSRRRECR